MSDMLLFLSDHWQHYQRALEARTRDEIEQVVADFRQSLGFGNHGYASMSSGVGPRENRYTFFQDFQGEWGHSYRRLHTAEAERGDARILQARKLLPPAAWNSLGHSNYDMPSWIRMHARRKLQEAGEFGLHSGITIPIHSAGSEWAFITFTHNGRVQPREFMPLLLTTTYFSTCLQTSMARIREAQAPRRPLLTDRERECLRWSAQGKTSWEISIILLISERTVNYHFQQAALKLRVKGRRAAIAQAIALGLIVL